MSMVMMMLNIIGILTAAALTAVAGHMAAVLIKTVVQETKINKIWRKHK